MLSRRHLIAATALAAPALISQRARAAGDTVRLGYIADYQNASLPAIAADQKMWEAEGLVPDVKVFTNGPIQIQAMGAGSLDFGAIGPGALWLPASGRTKVVSVNLLTFSDRVISLPEYPKIEDLRGKKVGVPQGTSGEMILRLTLAKANMTVADIDLVPMDPSTIVAAISSKQIAGAGLWYPLVDVIKRRVPGLHELSADQDFYPKISFPNTFVARDDTLKTNPELVRRFVRVLKRAMDYRAANVEHSVELSATMLGAPLDSVRALAQTVKLLTSADLVHLTQDGTVDGWFQNFNDMFKAFGTLKEALPPSDWYDSKLFVAA